MALSKKDEETVFLIAEKITGTSQRGAFRKDVLVSNVERRMAQTKSKTLADYLQLVSNDLAQYQNLVSDLTIHTTSWFRESPHFTFLQQRAREIYQTGKKIFSVWSVACSSGEEVYSIALVLESLKAELPGFEYVIHGSDIDNVSIAKGQSAIYDATGVDEIPNEYLKFVLLGSGSAKGKMTFDPEIRKRIHFFQNNLSVAPYKTLIDSYDVIFCRNVLIYFDRKVQEAIVGELIKKLPYEGMLILGHSDSFPTNAEIASVGRSAYQRKASKKLKEVHRGPRKILIVDDSATVRKVIRKILAPHFEVHECDSAEAADVALNNGRFDLVTLDLNMPGENGRSWLSRHRETGMTMPVVIVSDSSPLEAEKVFGALAEGAQDYIMKSRLQTDPEKIVELLRSLTEDRGSGLLQEFVCRPFLNKKYAPKVVLLGASTGGPESLAKVLQNFPKPCPPVVVVQHINPEFSQTFANRLAQVSGLKFVDYSDGQPLAPNSLYIATGDYHIKLTEEKGGLFLKRTEDEKLNGHRPSVDVLFKSAAQVSADTLSVLLTGMGKDGAEGLLDLAVTGRSYTLAQDEKSCVVFGMPKKAIELGAACFIGDLPGIRAEMIKRLK